MSDWCAKLFRDQELWRQARWLARRQPRDRHTVAPAEDRLLREKTVSESSRTPAHRADPEFLSDAELDEHIKHWHERRKVYREASRKLPKSDPDRFRLGWSAYWCSKIQDAALRERERRRSNES